MTSGIHLSTSAEWTLRYLIENEALPLSAMGWHVASELLKNGLVRPSGGIGIEFTSECREFISNLQLRD